MKTDPAVEVTVTELYEYVYANADSQTQMKADLRLAVEWSERVPDSMPVPEYEAGDGWDIVFGAESDAMDLSHSEAVDFEDWCLYEIDRHYQIMGVCGGVYTEIKSLEAAYSDVLQRL